MVTSHKAGGFHPLQAGRIPVAASGSHASTRELNAAKSETSQVCISLPCGCSGCAGRSLSAGLPQVSAFTGLASRPLLEVWPARSVLSPDAPLSQGVSATHKGIDIPKNSKDPYARAVSEGVIISVMLEEETRQLQPGQRTAGMAAKGLGNTLTVKDKETGLLMVYGHLHDADKDKPGIQFKAEDGSMRTVSRQDVGRSVKPNEVLGEVGSVGNSTGAHLHFEVVQVGADGQPVFIDPLTLLPDYKQAFATQATTLSAQPE
jgi:hypothetical protein